MKRREPENVWISPGFLQRGIASVVQGGLMRSVLALAICLCALFGCSSREPPLLLGVTALSPRSLEPGDRVEISGVGFPIAKPATVTLEGKVSRAGSPSADLSVNLPAESSSTSRLSFVLDPDLAEAFCGNAGSRAHATFRGRALVAFAPRISGAPPIVGILDDLTLEVFPARDADAVAALEESKRLQSFLGVELSPVVSLEGSTATGLRVGSVAPGGRAFRGGLEQGDTIVRANGVTVLTASDLIPAAQQRNLELWVQRGDAQSRTVVSLSVVGFSRVLADGYTWALALALAAVFLLLAFVVWPGRAFSHLGLRLSRRGSALSAPELGALAAKLHGNAKRGKAPSRTSLVLVGLSVAACFTLLTLRAPRLSEGGGVWICLLLLVVLRLLYAFVTSGLDRWHGFKLFRAIRATFQLALVEICGLCALVPLTLSSSNLRLQTVVGGNEQPWQWPALQSPFGLLLLGIFLAPTVLDATSSLANAELRSTHRVRRSRALALCDWTLILFKCEIAVALFLGGAMPFGTSVGALGPVLAILAHQLKYVGLALIVARLRTTLDFPRAEELTFAYLRWISIPVLLSAAASLISIEAERFALLRWLCAASGYGLCVALGVGCAFTLWALRRTTASASSINPWL